MASDEGGGGPGIRSCLLGDEEATGQRAKGSALFHTHFFFLYVYVRVCLNVYVPACVEAEANCKYCFSGTGYLIFLRPSISVA